MRFFRFLWGWWGAIVAPPAVTPAERIFHVAAETRGFTVAAEARGFIVAFENRSFTV